MLKERIVIKVGSSILVENQLINLQRMQALAELIASFSEKYEIILVSSGAVAAGYTRLSLDKSDLTNKQVLASIGQPLLMELYAELFKKYNIITSQILLTAYDFDSRKHTQNAQNAMEVLLKNGVLPIVNENDVIATGELKYLGFGDNDQLSAYVTHYFNASLLVILSDIDGYYDDNPHTNKNAKMYKTIHKISKEELEANATPHNQFATGGIVTKLKAANFLLENNKKMFLTSGYELEFVREFLQVGIKSGVWSKGTLFAPLK
ncbi:glutamate 5-kinase [Helicobacter burdigaliensis]|uniref:glutamate 5-kinase n=1 Tax=Helicobacter burdigaliensis TaxID=2315334 RepID=UPI000EF6D97A|nr:glutamate 5-kinase [Helicobacter burdigaliensis]